MAFDSRQDRMPVMPPDVSDRTATIDRGLTTKDLTMNQSETFSHTDASNRPKSAGHGKPFFSMTMSELQRELHRPRSDADASSKRIAELLAANNAEVEKRREAERRLVGTINVSWQDPNTGVFRDGKWWRDEAMAVRKRANETGRRAEEAEKKLRAVTDIVNPFAW